MEAKQQTIMWHAVACVTAALLLPPQWPVRATTSARTTVVVASEAGRLMRVATPASLLDQALLTALSRWPDLSERQLHSAVSLQQRLELTPEQTVRLMLAHPQFIDYLGDNPDLQLALDALQV